MKINKIKQCKEIIKSIKKFKLCNIKLVSHFCVDCIFRNKPGCTNDTYSRLEIIKLKLKSLKKEVKII